MGVTPDRPLPGIGHNGGPETNGLSWRRHCWRSARAALVPHLPIEIVRGRVRRARELGLDYKTYASVRAATGHDVVAFLFSSNALRVPGADAGLGRIGQAGRIGLAVAPLTPAALSAAQPLLEASHAAPRPWGRFGEIRAALRAAHAGHPAEGVVLVGDAPFEPEWVVAGRLGYYLPAARIFAQGL
ncbi:hypothetical protein IQ03_04234 [Gemmobacter caeni]|jgi:hypothetical protein|uniref:Uncharacterized protein n=1 Tax=Gemmobacter caeni TaxID=589035 RepID=A0A2T6AQA1_9RHOB|nr:hypothetical protein [Gemmobacter caeni]PTX46005.1 hypothetical protein C8N34_11968 [Gemmobacter caeni]TWI94307.1 hypothetical protein IQ03_04234 [Gemmobacter caeni]